MCDCLNELVKHATENKDIDSWDISLKMKGMNETFNERYIWKMIVNIKMIVNCIKRTDIYVKISNGK